MKWLLVVFVMSPIGDPAPTTIFQTGIASEALCRAAAADVADKLPKDKIGLVKVATVCLQILTVTQLAK